MWSRTVETAVKLGFAVNRGSVDGNVVPAADGTKPTFPVFSERPDVGTIIAVDSTVAIVTDETKRNPQTVMPPFGRNRILTEQEINAVVDFLQTL